MVFNPRSPPRWIGFPRWDSYRVTLKKNSDGSLYANLPWYAYRYLRRQMASTYKYQM